MKKIAFTAAWAMLATTVAFAAGTRQTYAATQVDCDAVMNKLNNGQHEKDVAKDLNTTLYQVRKCKRKAKAAAKAHTKSSLYSRKGRDVPIAPSSSAGTPSPEMAAPAAATSP